jgi:hypothetical protein
MAIKIVPRYPKADCDACTRQGDVYHYPAASRKTESVVKTTAGARVISEWFFLPIGLDGDLLLIDEEFLISLCHETTEPLAVLRRLPRAGYAGF